MKKRIMLFFACLFAMASMAMAQSKVSGNVTSSEDGLPIVGASIMVKGTTTGTVTDLDGNFTITGIPSSAKTLVVSYVGMKTKEVAIKANLNIVLDPDQEVLEEVVVTAQGLTRKDKSIGYAAQKVDGEKLQIARQTDLGNALAGKIAGARFVGGSGASFDSGSIVLRGTNGWSSPAGSEPIYVIDGTITNKNALNMDDVASINVLKGAAATALYGSQGGNGAVIVTTKSAAMDDGKGHIDFSHTTQWESYVDYLDMQKLYGGGSLGADGAIDGNDPSLSNVDTMGPEYLFGEYYGKDANGAYYYDYYSDESWGPRYDAKVSWADPLYLDGVRSTPSKWVHGLDLADLWRTGTTNTTNVAFSKSNKGNNTRVSFTNTDRQGIQYNSFAKRRYLTAKTTFQPTKWMNVSLDYKFTWRKTRNSAGTGYGALYSEYTQWGQTNVNLKDYINDYMRPDGTIRTWNITSQKNSTAMFHENPFAMMNERNSESVYTWNVISGDVEILLPYNFKAGFRVNANLRNEHSETKNPNGLPQAYTPGYSQSQNWLSDMTMTGRLTWNGRFMEDQLTVDAAAFGEERQYHYGTLSGSTSKGLAIPNFFNLSNSVDYASTSNSENHYITRAAYANVTMGFKDTYFLDANVRNDWDSRLSKSDNSFLYGGVSASVMLNQFIKNVKWLNYWKLRASAAQVGSTLGTYDLSDYFNTSKYNSDMTLYNRTTLINKEIKPTISTSYEIGTEFRLFNNRFWGDINWYTQDTKNQILSLSVPFQTGYSSRQINTGLVRNRGIEVSLGATIIKSRNFQWDLDLNLSHNQNTLVELGGGETKYSMGYNSFGSYARWYTYAVEGKPIGEIYGGGHLKRDDQGRLILAKTSSAAWGGGYMPQWQVISPDDQIEAGQSAGNYQADLSGGFGTTLRYKQFHLGMNFDFLIGGQIASWTNMYGEVSGILNSSAKINDRGVNEREPLSKGGGVHLTGVDAQGNPVDTYVNAYQYYHTKYNDSEAYIYDRTYLKLREISMGYSLSKKQLSKIFNGFVNSASLSFVATNPWLIYSAIPNVDGSEVTGTSYEGGSTGSTRSFGLTVKLGF
ncbi:MAG: SusC/RagA family TonB-linked outer membrane protein [Bacteroidales bacterium]|nr:SusC/RagA family TonB-linked outer membrane protein [Bacteroidales bacterium]